MSERTQREDGSEIPATGHELMRDLMRLASQYRDGLRGYHLLVLVDNSDTTSSVVEYTAWDNQLHLMGCLALSSQTQGARANGLLESPEDEGA